MSVFLLYLYLFVPASVAAPVATCNSTYSQYDKFNSSSTEIVGWTEAPQIRGTFDLLLSCLTTLSLCAWTAYHPNVLATQSEWKKIGHRLGWMCVAVFLPEVVLFCAWEQWWAARRLRDTVNGLGKHAFDGLGTEGEEEKCPVCGTEEIEAPQSEEDGLVPQRSHDSHISIESRHSSTPVPTKAEQAATTAVKTPKFFKRIFQRRPKTSETLLEPPTWTLEQAFFALSGGFALPTPYLPNTTHLTLTPPALTFLAQHGLLPASTPEAVTDKSKSDTIAKALVCIQAGWFLVQCLARVAQKLPLTLLEVHVLTHVLCAFAMYVVWFQKPYDVGSPIMCDNERVVAWGAFWALDVQGSSKHMTGEAMHCPMKNGEPPVITISHVQSAHENLLSSSSSTRYSHSFFASTGLSTLSSHLAPKSRSKSTPKPQPGSNSNPSASATPQQTQHLDLATQALTSLSTSHIHTPFQTNISTHPSPSQPSTHSHSLTLPVPYLVPSRSNLLIDGLAPYTDSPTRTTHLLTMLKTYSLMASLYGALHLSAWTFRFGSPAEMWTWRASGIVMVAAPVASLFAVGCFGGEGRLRVWVEKQRRGWIRWVVFPVKGLLLVGMMVGAIVALFCWAGFVGARVYVLGESFAALRAVEAAVYVTVEWTEWVPHVG